MTPKDSLAIFDGLKTPLSGRLNRLAILSSMPWKTDFEGIGSSAAVVGWVGVVSVGTAAA